MDDMDDENKENGMYLQAAIIFHKKFDDTFSEILRKGNCSSSNLHYLFQLAL